MADVFLSYSSADRAAAERVEAVLEARGIDVFIDQETPPGTDWDSWIRAKLADCKIALALWSKSSVKSPNVRHEAIIARDAGKLVPAMIDILEPGDFPMGLYMVQAINLHDWRNPESKGMVRLAEEITFRLNGTTPEPAATSRPTKAARNARVLVAGAIGLVLLTIIGVVVMPKESGTDEKGLPDARAVRMLQEVATGKDTFSKRMLGHWRWKDDLPCASGPNATLEGGRLVFTTPENRYVHMIDSDEPLKTQTTVLEPAAQLGHKYVLTPEFFATSETRSFNLIVEDLTEKTKDTWTPCEP